MEKDWSEIYKSGDTYQIEFLKGMLKENGIESVIINQKDSAYLIGSSVLYVQNNDIERARQLILEVEKGSE